MLTDLTLTYEDLIKFNLVERIEAKRSIPSETINKLYSALSDIKSIDQFIKESPSFPDSTDKILRSELVSVIGSTLSLEGVNLDKEETEEGLRKAEIGETLERKEQEADNSRKAYRFILSFVLDNKDNPIVTEQVIKQIHTYFTDGMNYVSNTPGKYRSNFTTSFGEPRKQTLCLTESEIETAMKNLVEWINRKETGIISSFPIVKAIMAHYYLTEIHPFGDGNGRTARAVEALILSIHGINNYCFWSLANFWSAHRNEYITHLHNIRVTLDPLEFIIWGLEGYRDEIRKVKARSLKKVKSLMLLDYVRYLLRSKREQEIKINHRIVDIIQFLIQQGQPIPLKKFYNLPQVLVFYKNTPSTRTRDFQKMFKLGLISYPNINDEEYIEVDFRILEKLVYHV